MPAIPRPTIGRVVHFTMKSYNSENKEVITTHPGQVLEYHEPKPPKEGEPPQPNRGEISLVYFVINQQPRYATAVPHHGAGLPNTWRYPPKEFGDIEVAD